MRACVTGFLLLIAASTNAAEPPKSPLSPEESLKHFVLGDPNLMIEIVAAEPEVIDPVSMQFDEHGRMWVVEMRDYPTGPQSAPPPLGGPDAKPLSRIKLLEDKDGDGRFETAHVFADNLLFATGVQPWDGGVIVTLAGEVAYFKDTDGDHKADVRETWFTGFAQANTQLRANHPTFGPDGWIYVANGLRGGNVIAVKKDWPSRLGLRPDPPGEAKKDKVGTESQPTGVSHDPANPVPVSLTGRDFKFDPLTGRYEAISGNGQFGLTFDTWGNRFVCDNRHPCRHVIFEEDFIKRCPHVAFPAVVHDVIPPDDKNKVFPLTSAWTTSNLHAGTFTAACGVTVYTGDWLPDEFRGNVFVCEPTGNLVQRAILEPDGVTFKSRNPHERSPVAQSSRHVPRDEPSGRDSRTTSSGVSDVNSERLVTRNVTATETQEFLASRDDWFRPVDLQNGPDGALYVVDMYRAVIEHPEWVPDELKNRPDTWLGNDKGRIYRIRPRSPAAPRQGLPNASPTSPNASTSNGQSTSNAESRSRSDRATLDKPIVSVANLDSSFNAANGWHRTIASRVLHELTIRSNTFPLVEPNRDEAAFLFLRSKRLGTFVGGSNAMRFLFDPNSRVTAEAVEHLLTIAASRELPAFESFLLDAIADDSPLVRFRAIQGCSVSPELIKRISANLAYQPDEDSQDIWMRQAIVGVVSHSPMPVFEHLFTHGVISGDQRHLARMLAEQVGVRIGSLSDESDINKQTRSIFEAIAGVAWSDLKREPNDFANAAEAALGFEKGLNRSGRSLTKTNLLFFDWCKDLPPPSGGGKRGDCSLGHRILSLLRDGSLSDDDVLLAVRLLRLGSFERAEETLKELGESATDQSLRLVVLETFASFHRSEVTAWLLDRYPLETPAARRAILSALMAPKERQLALLGAIADGKIAATEIDPVRAKQLTEAKDEAVREKARQVLTAAAPASRKEVLEAYQPALTLKGDAARGREVFQKNCVTCHRVADLGVNVAPDISDTRTKKPEQLLLDILDPNKAIDANYFAYAVVTKDGKAESGVIASESSNSITLKQPEGKTLTLLRSDIDELRNTGISLMPVGVEKNIDKQQMADLIFWLKNWRYLDGKVPATSLK